jgi:membrane protein implicated in regulation of membrane protease activity
MLALILLLDFFLAVLVTFTVKFIVDRKISLILDSELAFFCLLILLFVSVIGIYKYFSESRLSRIQLYLSVYLGLKGIQVPVYKDERLCVLVCLCVCIFLLVVC